MTTNKIGNIKVLEIDLQGKKRRVKAFVKGICQHGKNFEMYIGGQNAQSTCKYMDDSESGTYRKGICSHDEKLCVKN